MTFNWHHFLQFYNQQINESIQNPKNAQKQQLKSQVTRHKPNRLLLLLLSYHIRWTREHTNDANCNRLHHLRIQFRRSRKFSVKFRYSIVSLLVRLCLNGAKIKVSKKHSIYSSRHIQPQIYYRNAQRNGVARHQTNQWHMWSYNWINRAR